MVFKFKENTQKNNSTLDKIMRASTVFGVIKIKLKIHKIDRKTNIRCAYSLQLLTIKKASKFKRKLKTLV